MAEHEGGSDPGGAVAEQSTAGEMIRARRIPIGAEVLPGGGVHFRVWAPSCASIDVLLNDDPGQAVPLDREEAGYFSGWAEGAAPGMDYRYRIDGGDAFPDPASRWQPQGPHGPSRIIDPSTFAWTDAEWRGVKIQGQVIYELHLGTFTAEGTWEAAARELPELRDLGVTVVEVMPVADFPGEFGWGYDGVDLFAPYHNYGAPDDMRRFVDQAHALGLGVVLDVVYNHLGPDGAYHTRFSDFWFAKKDDNDWGKGLNFGGKRSAPVREYFASNAAYWVDEFHLDGLRLDATHAIHDRSPEHFLAEMARLARAAAGERSIILIAENEDQEVRLVRPLDAGGYGLDAIWNDDFHHTAVVAMTKRAEAYYSDYHGSPQELISSIKWGFLFQGQHHGFSKARRGTPTFGVDSAAFITCLENHDQVSNSARGDRPQLLTSPGLYKAMTSLMLLGPGTPMLFQGQEFASSTPFLYFADHVDTLAENVHKGRIEFLSQFRSIAHPEVSAILPDPGSEETFRRSKLDFAERERNRPIYDMYRDLLAIRRDDPVFRSQRGDRVHGATFGLEAFVLRFFGEGDDSRLLLINLGRDLHLRSAAEPLLAPPFGTSWDVLWYSEAVRYGGCWAPPVVTDTGWELPGHAAVVLAPVTR